MNTHLLLTKLNSRCIVLRLDGAGLIATPRERVTKDLLKLISDHKAALVDYLSSSVAANDDTHHGDNRAFLGRLRTELGEDWDEISSDPAQLEAFARLFRTDECRRQGKRPAHYTATAICRGCGPVSIFEGTAGHVLGCPWCYNRVNGLPIPSPLLPWTGLEEGFRICRRVNDAGQDVQCVDMLARRLFKYHHDDLRRSAGKDWSRISSDPDRLLAFMFTEARRLIHEAGLVADCDKDQDLV
jgi:hypothetical protein